VSPAKPRRALSIALWVVQVLLAAMFLMSGFMKLSQPIAALAGQMPWVTSVPETLVRFIGTAVRSRSRRSVPHKQS
jgi:putative oxidoreductase